MLGAAGLVRLQVIAEAGSQLVVRSKGKIVATATATGTAQVIAFNAVTGRRTFVTTATDDAGNRSAASEVTVEPDATPPVADDVAVEPGSRSDARSHVALRTDAQTRYKILIDEEVVARGLSQDGNLERWLPLADGVHRVAIDLQDQVGNRRLLKFPLRVRVPTLLPSFERVSDLNVADQVFELRGSPGTNAVVRVLGGVTRKLPLRRGTRELTLTLRDGSYPGAVMTLVDEFGRKGRVTLAGFTIDTQPPTVKVTAIAAKTAAGLMAFSIAGEPAASVAWRVLDAQGHVIRTGTLRSSTDETPVEFDVEKGDYAIEVTAQDSTGNSSTETMELSVADDPVTAGAIAAWVVGMFLFLLVMAILAWVLWRNRRRITAWRDERRARAALRAIQRQHAAAVRAHQSHVVEYDAAMQRYERADDDWRRRRDVLARLHQFAQTGRGAEESGSAHLKLRRGERAYGSVNGALVDTRTHQGVARLTVVDAGLITVTSARLVFEGLKKREWAFDKTESLRHMGEDRTIVTVSNRKNPSGVEYPDSEHARLFLDLAWADFHGSRTTVVETMSQRVQRHEHGRPQPPTHPGEPPLPPESSAPEPARPSA